MIIKKIGTSLQASGISLLRQRSVSAGAWRLNPGACRGFTLIETFVAIVILTTSLAGALSLAAQGFNSADLAGDQITASFLAQDAIEYVRFVRDSNTLSSEPDWLSNLRSNCVSVSGAANPKSCFLDSSQDYNGNNNKNCPGGVCPPMYFDSASGLYNYAAGSSIISNAIIPPNSATNAQSKFTRTVSITSPVTAGGSSDEAQVTVCVSWIGRGGVQGSCTGAQLGNRIILQENIHNWQ